MADSSNPMELQEILQEALADETFVKELLAMERAEDIQLALEEKDIELSLDEINQIGELIRKVQSGEISQEQVQRLADGELSEEELEQVSGGIVLLGQTILWIILGVVGGGTGGLFAFLTGW